MSRNSKVLVAALCAGLLLALLGLLFLLAPAPLKQDGADDAPPAPLPTPPPTRMARDKKLLTLSIDHGGIEAVVSLEREGFSGEQPAPCETAGGVRSGFDDAVYRGVVNGHRFEARVPGEIVCDLDTIGVNTWPPPPEACTRMPNGQPSLGAGAPEPHTGAVCFGNVLLGATKSMSTAFEGASRIDRGSFQLDTSSSDGGAGIWERLNINGVSSAPSVRLLIDGQPIAQPAVPPDRMVNYQVVHDPIPILAIVAVVVVVVAAGATAS